MRKILIFTLFAFIFIALSLNAFAQMCGCMGGAGGAMRGSMMESMEHQGTGSMHVMDEMMMVDDHPMWKFLLGLGLDDKQKEALMVLRSKTMKDTIKKRADEQIAGIELRDLLSKEPVDMKAVEAAVKKRESLRTETFLAHVKAHEEMKSILTPEQRKQLKEMESGHGAGCGMMGSPAEHKGMPMHEHMH